MPFTKGNPGGPGRPKGPGTGPGSIRVTGKGKPGRKKGGGSKQLFTALFNEALDDSMFDDFITQLRKGIKEGAPWALKLLASKVIPDKQELTVTGQFDGDTVWERIIAEYAEYAEFAPVEQIEAVGQGETTGPLGRVEGPALAASLDGSELQLPAPPAISGEFVSTVAGEQDMEPAGSAVADRPREE